MLSSNKIIAPLININSIDWKKKLICDCIKSQEENLFYRFIIRDVYVIIILYPEKKYTLELICHGYIHLLPNRYVLYYSEILINSISIYSIVGLNNFLDLTKFLIKNNFSPGYITYISFGAMTHGNLEILKYLKQHKYKFDHADWKYAVMGRQLRVLKWAKNNGYCINTWIFNYAIQNKDLNILKWAYKNNYIDANIYRQI